MPNESKKIAYLAPHQRTILSAFQEDSWPIRIDDPLPPREEHDTKRTLHDAINSLNRGHETEIIIFRGDGDGLGILWEVVNEADDQLISHDHNGKPPDLRTPIWDRDRKQLRVGDQVIKHFRVPAPCQEAILAAFNKDGWPARIDDPLPPSEDQDCKRGLSDAIAGLNRCHKTEDIIRFKGDGSGSGVVWEIVAD